MNSAAVNTFTQQTNSNGYHFDFGSNWIVRSSFNGGNIKNSLIRMDEIIITTSLAPTTTAARRLVYSDPNGRTYY